MFKLPMMSVVGDLIGNILENKAVLIAIVTFAATVLMRCGIKIYNMGRLSKADLITRQEFKELEEPDEELEEELVGRALP